MSKKKELFKVSTDILPIPELEGKSELSFFDQENADINLFNLIDDELIRIAGSELLYYKFLISEDYDEVYLEARNKAIVSEPVNVYGHYEPKPVEQNLTEFGIELTNDQLFVFNKSYIEAALGRQPLIGDQIKPQFQNQKYEIIEVQEEGFEMYGVYHMACTAKLLRDNEETLNQDTSDKVDDVGGYLDIE